MAFSRVVRANLVAGLVLFGSLSLGGGCDSDSADKRVDHNIAQALPKLSSGTTEELNQAQTLLDKAVLESGASAPLKIRAKALQGQCQLELAAALQPEIDDTTLQINRLAWDIQALTAQIQAHNQMAAALAMYDPSKLQDNLKKEVDEATGSDQQADWVKTEKGSIPTLTSAIKDIASLTAQVTELQNKIKALTDQRNQLQASGDQLTQQSELAKGDQAVAIFRQAADSRKQADTISLQIDQANNLLARAQADLAVKQGQQTVLNQAIADFGDQTNNSSSSWVEVQKAITAQRDAAKALLGSDSATTGDNAGGGLTIAAKAAAIAQLAQKNQAARSQALPYLNTAISNFRDAASMAGQLQQEVQTRNSGVSSDKPEAVAGKALVTTLNSGRYKMMQANAQARLAALYAGQAAEANTRLQLATQLKPILDQAKLPVPSALQDSDNKIADAIQTGRKDADAAYQEADSLLSGVVEGAYPEDQRKAAHAARMFDQYNWYLLAASVADPNAMSHLQAAQGERDAILQNGGTLRNLPAELAVAPTTAPAPGGAAVTPPPTQ